MKLDHERLDVSGEAAVNEYVNEYEYGGETGSAAPAGEGSVGHPLAPAGEMGVQHLTSASTPYPYSAKRYTYSYPDPD
ncbi:hypothetical protein L6Q96_17140 [Candidatus Binatia bacterium]|nr:hypothetical protein [Candidatus Binatia bacterium]MCK6556284.1 hypothetical protein [Candidatus Binatia bacterium]